MGRRGFMCEGNGLEVCAHLAMDKEAHGGGRSGTHQHY